MNVQRATRIGRLRTCTCRHGRLLTLTSLRAAVLPVSISASSSRRWQSTETDRKVHRATTSKGLPEVLPFNLPFSRAKKVVAGIALEQVVSKHGKLGWVIQLIKKLLGLSNVLPDYEVVRWKPIYLPWWRYDFSVIVQARFEDEQNNVSVGITNLTLPGTNVAPLSTSAINIPEADLKESLAPFEPSKHSRPILDAQDGEPAGREGIGPAVPIPFTVFPGDLPEHVRRSLTAVRDDLVRFTGEMDIILFAAYPFYAPYYLMDLKDKKQSEDAPTVTALVYGRHSNIEVAAFGKGAALRYPFGFWDREKGVWLPLQPVQAEFDIRAYRRNRPKQDDEGYSPFSRNNPIDAAKAAAQSGSFDGAQFGLEFNRLASTRFRTAVERIGTLFQRLYPETMEKVIVASTIKNANPSLDEIRREMSATEHFMPLSKNAEGNRRHIAACVEHNDAKEFLLHAKAMPEFPKDANTKIVAITPGKGIKLLSPSELAEQKKATIKEAEEKVRTSKEEVQKTRPSWLAKGLKAAQR